MAGYPGAMENGLFWGLLATWQGLAFSGGLRLTLLFGVAGLILACAIVEDAHSLAFHDELTGLPSRRALNEYFLRLSGPFAVAMLDVDFFKKFNDNFGHDVGDQVLKMVAARIALVRNGGKAFRYGGEEFTVVFPRRITAEVLPCLEKVRQSVEDSGFTLRSQSRKSRNGKARGGLAGRHAGWGSRSASGWRIGNIAARLQNRS
jgi:diguanylate cyclase (GGDEF)-like protein